MQMIDGRIKEPLDFGWTNGLIGALVPIYGLNGAARIASVILPGVLKDFRRCLQAAEPGQTVSESYTVDDNQASLRLVGRRMAKKNRTLQLLEELYVNDVPVPLRTEDGESGAVVI